MQTDSMPELCGVAEFSRQTAAAGLHCPITGRWIWLWLQTRGQILPHSTVGNVPVNAPVSGSSLRSPRSEAVTTSALGTHLHSLFSPCLCLWRKTIWQQHSTVRRSLMSAFRAFPGNSRSWASNRFHSHWHSMSNLAACSSLTYFNSNGHSYSLSLGASILCWPSRKVGLLVQRDVKLRNNMSIRPHLSWWCPWGPSWVTWDMHSHHLHWLPASGRGCQELCQPWWGCNMPSLNMTWGKGFPSLQLHLLLASWPPKTLLHSSCAPCWSPSSGKY